MAQLPLLFVATIATGRASALLTSPAAAARSTEMTSFSMGKVHGVVKPGTARLMKQHLEFSAEFGSPFNSTPSSRPTNGSVWPVAIYWINVEIGTPPKQFPVAIDSGSGDLDIQGPGCANCPKTPPNNAYDPSQSSTSKAAFPYAFSNTYETCDLSDPSAPCTISGKTYVDKVSANGLGPVDVHFGAITKQTSNFDQFKRICGVMGLLGNSNSNVFQSLVRGGAVSSNVWSMCLVPGSKGNGTLTFGGADERLYSSPVRYTPNTGGSYYAMELSGGVKVGDTVVGSTAGKSAILDSGTNVLLLKNNDFAAMRTLFTSMCGSTNLHGVCDVDPSETLFDGKCLPFTEAQMASFPNITIAVNGFDLTMHPRDYILPSDPRATSPDQLCLGVRPSSLFIIGDTTMQNYYVVFDNENNQIGWAEVNRDNCGSI